MKKIKIKNVEPKNKKQKEFVNLLCEHPVVFAVGSAGSGKTYLSAFKAMEQLSYGFVNKIVIVRPAVATEDLGFLPGDIRDKLDPYLAPITDAFSDITNPIVVQELMFNKVIEIAPLAFMRGRTFSNAFIILDEAQNTTVEQMKLFLTRFGENVKVVITGDMSQSDIKGQNGLAWAVNTLKSCKSVAIVKYEGKDIVRSSLVRDILFHIEKSEKNDSSSKDIPNSEENIGTGVLEATQLPEDIS